MSNVTFKSEALQKHREIADQIKANLKAEGAVITEEKSHKPYNDNLPEGITPETVKTIAKYNNQFVRSAHLAVAETAAGILNKDKKIDRVEAKVGFFAPSDAVNLTVDRSKTYPNPQAKDGQPDKITKHLVISTSMDIRGQGLKSVKEEISSEFKDRFVS